MLNQDQAWAIAKKIEGWCPEPQARKLYELALRKSEGDVVEVGSWKGRSAVMIGAGVGAAGQGKMFTVDAGVGVDQWGAEGNRRESRRALNNGIQQFKADVSKRIGVDSHSVLTANMELAGLSDLVENIKAWSTEAVERFADNSLSMLYIDGSHLYEGVKEDFEVWSSKVVVGGVVAFDDSVHHVGVARLMGEIANLPEWTLESAPVANLTWFRKVA